MTDETLVAELAALGIEQANYRVVMLLPLVQVAWADGRIQPAELEIILQIAQAHGVADGPSSKVLEGWLRTRPDAETVTRGQRVLVELTHRQRGLGSALPDDTITAIIGLCTQVASAAGGLFDFLFTVEESERRALEEISHALRSYSASLMDALPEPDGGQFTDL